MMLEIKKIIYKLYWIQLVKYNKNFFNFYFYILKE